jgi:alpha-L-rhamnosidase
MTSRIDQLQFERRESGLGVGTATPRISWHVNSPNPSWKQSAYQVEVRRQGIARLFYVEGADSVLVPWPDHPLQSRERGEVRVRAHSRVASETTDWSAWSEVDALLAGTAWTAVAVGPGAPEGDRDGRPALLRHEFDTPAVTRALLRVTAQGLFEVEINGQRVGDDALAPGWTAYQHRMRILTYDVTHLVRAGANAIGTWLADGWFRGRLGFNGGHRNLYGDRTSFFAELELTDQQGDVSIVATDSSWKTHASPILRSGLYDGEHFDAVAQLNGWSRAGFDDSVWAPVEEVPFDTALLVSPDGPPVRCTEELRPASVSALPGQRYLIDFGQNFAGRLRIRAGHSTPGEHIVLRHAEVLQDGELYTRPLREAAATDVYTSDGGPIDWEPRFTLHGFRFAEVSGWSGSIRDLEVIGRAYHTDMRRTGGFECSDALLNRLHENVVWSMRSNFVDIPTDCPQRDERLGWTGDIQVFTPTAAGLYDVSGFLASWLKDLAAEQLADGTVPWYVPVIPGGSYWTPIRPSAVWGDAAVLIPWTLFQHYADRGLLSDQYDSARAWVDLIAREAGESYLWQSGQQLGDWLDPTAPPEDPTDAKTDAYLVASAYFVHSARILSHIAAELDKHEDAAEYSRLANAARSAFRTKYVTANGSLTNHAQAAYALAIAFDLFEGAELLEAGKNLRDLVSQNDYRIGTGFAGTPVICSALSKAGQTDSAYRLLLERGCPSWLYTVLSGGTTMWERWDSQLPDGTINPGEMTSFNHYALGSVAEWLYSTVSGLIPTEPAFRRFRVAPQPGGGLTWAHRDLSTPYGLVETSWRIEEETFTLALTVPSGTEAEVILPSGASLSAGPGRHEFSEPALVSAPAA